MNEQTYYNAKDIAAMLGISMGKAYKILREMNQELSSKGLLAVYFKEKQITAPMIRKWQGEMLQKGFKPTDLKTINNQLSSISQAQR